eukprot:sb/3478192/
MEKGLTIMSTRHRAFVKCPSPRAIFFGDNSDWRDISKNHTWEEVSLGLKEEDPQYNKETSCSHNVARLSIGCRPQSRMYDTNFHIKISFCTAPKQDNTIGLE